VTSPTSTFATSTSATASTSESILALTSASLSTPTSSASPSASETSSETSASTAPTASSTGVPASGGLSTGATVGLAVAGVGIFLVLGFIFALVYRKRSQKKIQEAYGKPEDEKTGGAAAGAVYTNSNNNNLSRADTITCEKAPRVPSLRPVTQFLPNLTVTPPAAEPASQQQSQAQVRPQPQQQVPMAAASPVGLTRSESRKAPPPALVLTKSGEEVPSAPVSAATTANSVAPLLAKTQTSSIASSSSTEYTDGGSVAGTPVTGGPAGAVNTSPVHRVQMDFKPSMEDELGLRVGGLVRLLYEYDDGWVRLIFLNFMFLC